MKSRLSSLIRFIARLYRVIFFTQPVGCEQFEDFNDLRLAFASRRSVEQLLAEALHLSPHSSAGTADRRVGCDS
jgi:hypothetical protein